MNFEALAERFEKQQATIGILGLGYVGLPLAREFCECQAKVIGFDIDAQKVETLNRGVSYIDAVPSSVLKAFVDNERFIATADFERIKEADALLICVPTPLDKHKQPDLGYVEKTAESIAQGLRTGQLVVLESTTYPGTTDEFLKPLLERVSGLKAGHDFALAYSPERENPGDDQWRTRDIPKVVGADDAGSQLCAKALYGSVVSQVVAVSSCRVAEASKLLENIYRCVNIALVNELKILFQRMDIDIFEVIEASKTKPFGFKAFYPGPGLGGHCIPIDPFYLSWKARQYDFRTKFIELAGEINTRMPAYVIERCLLALNDQKKSINGSKILVLGVAYKENVDDDRESPALAIIQQLTKLGAEIQYHDPHIASIRSGRKYDLSHLASVELTPQRIAEQDLVLLVTAHAAVDYQRVQKHASLIVDTRNVFAGGEKAGFSNVIQA